MIRIMVMNGLLISLILIWTSAAKEPSAGYLIKSSTKHPTGPLNYSVSKPMVSLHETNKEILRRKFLCGSELGGVCVNKKKSCPSNLPSEKSPGKPYCSKKKDRCCYPDPTTAAPPTVVPTTTTTSEDVNWSDIRNACIKSNNYKTYQPLALDICKEKCVEEDAINCQSIEYSSAQQMCAISEARSDSDDFIEPCFVDGWVFAEIELNAGPTTGAPTTLAPSNTTINVSSCNLVWNYEEDRPLIMIRETKTIVPPIIDIEISEDPNRIPEGKKLIFACPGENNQFNHVQGTHTKLHGECISHEQFKVCVNNYPEILDLSQLSCSSKMQPSIIKQDNDTSYEKSCEDIGGELYKFGYIYGDYREFKDLDTKFCFREKDQTTLWTSTNIDRIEISPSMRSMDPANFRTARGLAMNTFYSQKSQQETLKEILDKEVTSVWNDKACRNHGGHCVRGGRPCPKHLPHHTSQGEPFCTSFYRCCYSEQCDPTTCTYKGQKGHCSLDSMPGTTGVASQECKKGCQCYIKDNKTLHQFKNVHERKELSKLLKGTTSGGEDKMFGIEEIQSQKSLINPLLKVNSDSEDDTRMGRIDPVCSLPLDEGTGYLVILRFYYDGVTRKCIEFTYWGLNGNANRFETYDDCYSKCGYLEGCKIEWHQNYDGSQPIVYYKQNDKNHIFYGSIIKHEAEMVFACAGEQNTFQNQNGQGNAEVMVKCDGDEQKLTVTPTKKRCIGSDGPNKIQVDNIGFFGCKDVNKPSMIKYSEAGSNTQERCDKRDKDNKQMAVMYRIGFHIGINIFPLIDICFDEHLSTTIWTSHTLQGEYIGGRFSMKNHPDFDNFGFPETIKNHMNDIYKTPSQYRIFKGKLDRPDIICKDGNLDSYLAKGHLAPRSDFVTETEQKATYYFMNAIPQWQNINGQGGNWALIERRIQKLAEDRKANGRFEIFTGGYGILELKNKKVPIVMYLGNRYIYNEDSEENEDIEEYTYDVTNTVPVPAYTWKIVLYEGISLKQGVAFVVINNPLLELGESEINKPKCATIVENDATVNLCSRMNWLKSSGINLIEVIRRFNEPNRGLTYCCRISEFLTEFKEIGSIIKNPLAFIPL